jgi:hypothetical protein
MEMPAYIAVPNLRSMISMVEVSAVEVSVIEISGWPPIKYTEKGIRPDMSLEGGIKIFGSYYFYLSLRRLIHRYHTK